MKKATIDWRNELTDENVLRMCVKVQKLIETEPSKMKQAVYDFNFEDDFMKTTFKIDSPEFETHAAFMVFMETQSHLCNRIVEAYQVDPNGDPIENPSESFFEPLWSAFVNWVNWRIFIAQSRNELQPEPSKTKKNVKNKKSN